METCRKFKTPRKRNFTDLECNIIIDELSTNREIYIGKFSATITKESKANAWDALAMKINSMCGYSRSGKDVEKKWYNLQQTAVKEVGHFSREMQKTGGGNHPKEPSQNSVKIVDSIVNPAKVIGIPGGIDSTVGEMTSCSESCDIPPDMDIDLEGALDGSGLNLETTCSSSIEQPEQLERPGPQNLLQKLRGFNEKCEQGKRTQAKNGQKVEQDKCLNDLVEYKKRQLPTDEERALDKEIKMLKVKKLKLEIEFFEVDFKLKEKEMQLKDSMINLNNLKSQLLQYSISEKEAVTYVVENVIENNTVP